MSLLCKILGHKYHYDTFTPDGGYEQGVSGVVRVTGTDVRVETN